MNYDWYIYAIMVIVGCIAGFLNTLAGSGSALNLAVMMFLGIPANVANETNRIAILFQNIVGVSNFKKKKVFEFKEGIYLAIPTILGSLIGSYWAVNISKEILEKTIAYLLFGILLTIIFKPDAWIKSKANKAKSKPGIFLYLIFFLIGIYGGFIQAGVGFILLAGLVLGAGHDLLKSNALKVFIVLLYTPFTLWVFIMKGNIDFVIGLTLSIGNMTGAYIASNMAVKKGSEFIRYILIFVLIAAVVHFSGIF
ncbi:MAG: sulfite exporter TauE/SafE family protein [Marinifilaceae bacterium]|jgi:uncharacterized membrane protein YfcA|nr:sulfite exporter TauE/SafE family protein [Marinifilaceae bacterium]